MKTDKQQIVLQIGIVRSIMVVVLLSVLLASCGGDVTPEEEVRSFVAAGEEAVETRDVGDLKNLISENYKDEHDRTRRDIVAVAARYLYANKNIHVLTRIDELTFPAPDNASLTIFAAMTGQNVSDLDALLNMQADLYRFDVELAREGKEWKLVRANWRPARGEDFF